MCACQLTYSILIKFYNFNCVSRLFFMWEKGRLTYTHRQVGLTYTYRQVRLTYTYITKRTSIHTASFFNPPRSLIWGSMNNARPKFAVVQFMRWKRGSEHLSLAGTGPPFFASIHHAARCLAHMTTSTNHDFAMYFITGKIIREGAPFSNIRENNL